MFSAFLLIAVVALGFFGLFGDSSQAAGNIYIVNGFQETMNPSQTYELTTSSMQLELKTSGTAYDDDRYKVEWTIEDTQARDIIASVEQSTSNKMIANVHALSPGNVTITVTVKDSMEGDAVLGSTTCNIYVKFAIDTSKDVSIFKKIYDTDAERSLVLYTNSEPVQLDLNFGEVSDAQWSSDNDEIVAVTQNGGLVTPRGAGHTLVTAAYTSERDPSTTYTALLDVYVIPRVSTTDGTNYQTNLRNQTLASGSTLYTDTLFTNQNQVIRNKITWVVKQDDGNGGATVLVDSANNKTSPLISVTPTNMYSNELQITGTAGSYYIEFYTSGTYSSETVKTTAYEPTVVEFTLLADIDDKTVTLGPGDSYDLAKAFGMTTADFLSCFTGTNSWLRNGQVLTANYASYNVGTATLTIASGAPAGTRLEDTITVSSAQKRKVAALMGLTDPNEVPNSFTITVIVEPQLRLNATDLTIVVGQTAQLMVEYNGDYNAEDMVWSSEDTGCVTIDPATGSMVTVTGKKKTDGNSVKVTVSLPVTDENGNPGAKRITASCNVIVEPTLSSFKLDPNVKEMEMFVGDITTIKAIITPVTITNATLSWTCSTVNNPPFTVAQASDGKSAVITATQTGTADLVVTNTANNNKVSVRITVKSSIQSISLAYDNLERPMYAEGYNMYKDVSYTPANATDVELLWTSSDTGVATVNEEGYVTFVNAGPVVITVRPKNNPNGVVAQCFLTIVGSATSIQLSDTDITMNVGEAKGIDVTYFPVNTIANIDWNPDDTSIVSVDYNSDKKILTVTGKSPGKTSINAISPQTGVNTIKVTVKQPSESVSLSPKALSLRSGQSAKVTATLSPATSTDSLVWTSLNTGVATVDTNGNVTAVKEGVTFIRVQAFNDKTLRSTEIIQVTVQDGISSISLDSASKTVKVGKSITLTPIFNPTTAYDKTMSWTSADTGIAKVELSGTSNAKVTGVKEGVTLITGTSKDGGHIVSCMITVVSAQDEPTKVTVSPKTKFLAVGKKFTVKATVTGASNKKVKWSSSNKKVATVTKKGKVKGKKVGTAYIKAKAKDGSGASARCKVRVVRKIKKLKLNRYSAKLLIGNSLKLKARLTPKNATIKTVNWTSSDNSIATVSSTGRVLALAEGLVRITATTKDGTKKKATCLINVTEPVEATGVTVENSSITLVKGRSQQSGIVAQPANTTTSIKYYSDNRAVATVDSHGKIKAKAVGQATIYGETSNGQIGYVDVQVVDLNRKGIVMRQYDTEQLYVNDVTTGVTWYSKNPVVATVSPSGLVTGRKKGTTTVYAVVNGVKLGCRVKIKKIK